MPPGIKRPLARARAIDLATAGACIDVVRRIQRARRLAGDEAGAEVAWQVAQSIEEELLKGAKPFENGEDAGSWYWSGGSPGLAIQKSPGIEI